MKKLIYMLLTIMLAFSLVGCQVKPIPPVIVVVNDIICEGGHYTIRYSEWTPTGCPDSEFAAGSFWVNKDGRMFRIADKMSIDELRKMFGNCPNSYIEELIFKVVK